MTAEIAILNRMAVALAADSAVTLSVRGQEKIYNSVDKLFQLSHVDPVGIMVFGGAEFMEIPIETVIKGFRSSRYSGTKESLGAYVDAFFSYLENEIPVPVNIVERNVDIIVYGELYSIKMNALNSLLKALQSSSVPKKFDQGAFIIEKTMGFINSRIEKLSTLADCNVFLGKTGDNLIEEYAAKIDEVISDVFEKSLTEEIKEKSRQLASLVLIKNEYSSGATGFVFAGFGSSELFPKLISYETDGVIAGKVKRAEKYRLTSIEMAWEPI